MTKINYDSLTEKDLGRKVIYKPEYGAQEEGRLSSFRDGKIWVRFKGPTGECTPIKDCEFLSYMSYQKGEWTKVEAR